MPIVLLPGAAPSVGREPVVLGARNGVMPPAPCMSDLSYLVNLILAKRPKVLFHEWINEADCYDTTTQADTWRFMWRSGPNGTRVRCRMILAPVEDTEVNAPDPRVFWTTDDGTTATAQATIYSNVRVSASTIDPDEWIVVQQDWTAITADTLFRATLTQVDRLRVLSCTVWELPDSAYDTASDVVINPKGFNTNQGIYDRDLNDLVATLTTLWKQQGTVFFNWTRPSTAAITTINTSYVNVVDTGTTAWAAASEGFYSYPQYHGALETFNSGTNRETVPIVFWAYLAISDAAQTVTVALVDSNNTTASPIATVTRTGATSAAFVTATASWSAPSNASMKLDVYFKTSDAGATASVYAAGCFMYSS